MTEYSAFFLGILQGITEFLPISSSGHLVLIESFFELSLPQKELLFFDIVLHAGSLLAIVMYFFSDIWSMVESLWKKEKTTERTMVGILILATIPLVLISFFLQDEWIEFFRQSKYVGMTMIASGILFLLAEKWPQKKTETLSWKKGLIIGCMQSIALIPGVSRSGTTISTGMLLGMDRMQATRFSFLLGIPALLGAFCWGILSIQGAAFQMPEFSLLIIGFLTSFLFGLGSIAFLLRFVQKHSLSFFSVYLFVIGGIVLF